MTISATLCPTLPIRALECECIVKDLHRNLPRPPVTQPLPAGQNGSDLGMIIFTAYVRLSIIGGRVIAGRAVMTGSDQGRVGMVVDNKHVGGVSTCPQTGFQISKIYTPQELE